MLLRESRELLQRAGEMLDRVRTASQSVRLRVGYAPSLASGLLSAAVENFAQKHPNARVELFDLSTKEMLAGLEDDTLDAVLTVGLDRDAHGFKWTQLIRASWQLAVNRHHPLARKARVTPAEVALGPLLVFCQRVSHRRSESRSNEHNTL
jgi:DNA-binding transcriptional LysR family regulator